jgi:D-tyrosyl-tRNA(Tyr) deacylase
MRAVVQRVASASVVVGGTSKHEVAAIDHGLLVLVGVHTQDTPEDARLLADKVAHLRIMEDADGKLNLSLLDTGGSALVVSNFTLYGDCRKGRRPSFVDAARGEQAEGLYRAFGAALTACGVPVQYGQFGAEMQVSLVNDGPVTLVLDTAR